MKVPHVQGKLSEQSALLTERWSPLAECGYEKFWTRRKTSGLCGFGTRDMGEDWKGPIRASSSVCVKGPRYRPLICSLRTMPSKVSACCRIDGLLSGV